MNRECFAAVYWAPGYGPARVTYMGRIEADGAPRALVIDQGGLFIVELAHLLILSGVPAAFVAPYAGTC